MQVAWDIALPDSKHWDITNTFRTILACELLHWSSTQIPERIFVSNETYNTVPALRFFGLSNLALWNAHRATWYSLSRIERGSWAISQWIATWFMSWEKSRFSHGTSTLFNEYASIVITSWSNFATFGFPQSSKSHSISCLHVSLACFCCLAIFPSL